MPILIFGLYILASWGVAWAGENRKFGFWGYFFCSLLFTPLIGMLFVIASEKVDPSRAKFEF